MSDGVLAAHVTAIGGPPSHIRVGHVAEPALAPRHVRLRALAVAVDPVDALVRSGAWPTEVPLPFVVGRDVVGEVVEVGDDVDGIAVGDRAWSTSLGHDGRQGACAQRVVVPVDHLHPLPAGADPVGAVASLHPATTAWLGLVREAALAPGQVVLVGGAGGNVGTAVVQFAVAMGARVVATARPRDHDWCRRLGAEVVVDHAAPDAAAELDEAVPDGVDVHWDTSGHHDLAAAVRLVRPGGRILATAAVDPVVDLPVRELYQRDVQLRGFVVSRATVGELARVADVVNGFLGGGGIAVRIDRTGPLGSTRAAHERLEAGTQRGRTVILPGLPADAEEQLGAPSPERRHRAGC